MGLDLKKNERIEGLLIHLLDEADNLKIVSRFSFPWSAPDGLKILQVKKIILD
jgi:hypothetical protein